MWIIKLWSVILDAMSMLSICTCRDSNSVIHFSGSFLTSSRQLLVNSFFNFNSFGALCGLYFFTRSSHAELQFSFRKSSLLQFLIKLKVTLPELVVWFMDNTMSLYANLLSSPSLRIFLSLSLLLVSSSYNWSCIGILSLPRSRPLYPLHFTCARNFLGPSIPANLLANKLDNSHALFFNTTHIHWYFTGTWCLLDSAYIYWWQCCCDLMPQQDDFPYSHSQFLVTIDCWVFRPDALKCVRNSLVSQMGEL